MPTTPNPGVVSPELGGARFLFGAGLEGSDTTSAPTEAKYRSGLGNGLYGSALYAPTPPLAIGLALETLGGYGASPLVKYQFLGKGFKESEAGNISALLYARAGATYNFSGIDTSSARQGHPEDSCGQTGEGHSSFVHYGVSGGYRFRPRWMLFGGFAMGHSWNNSRDYTVVSSSPVQCGTTDFSNYGHLYTYGLGTMIKIWRDLHIEGSLEVTEFYFNDRSSRMEPFLHVGAAYAL